jgi:exodeoxyribonuclease-3
MERWTHWANARERNVGWRIDYFFASSALLPKIKSSRILASELGSDHCPIELEIQK